MWSYKSLIGSWDRFFFEPRPVDSIAIFRIFWCVILLIATLLDLNNIDTFYGPHSLISLGTVRSQFPQTHLNIFHLFNVGYEFVYVLFGIYILSLIFSILGFYTRTSLIVALVCMVSLHQRNIWILSSSELLMRLMTILLICSPCGHAFSVDSILGRKFASFKKPREWSPWAMRLIQIQLSVVYIWTVWHKLKGDTWFDGTALYYATRLENMKNFSVPFLLNWMPFLKVATWGTLVIELALGTLIWFKEFRKPLIVVGILFHVGIEYMMAIPYFEMIMILLLLLFITPEEVRAFVTSTKAKLVKILSESKLSAPIKEKLVWVMAGDQ